MEREVKNQHRASRRKVASDNLLALSRPQGSVIRLLGQPSPLLCKNNNNNLRLNFWPHNLPYAKSSLFKGVMKVKFLPVIVQFLGCLLQKLSKR